jgi:hypothetical protein
MFYIRKYVTGVFATTLLVFLFKNCTLKHSFGYSISLTFFYPKFFESLTHVRSYEFNKLLNEELIFP